MEGSMRATTHIGHLYSSTKNKQINKKNYKQTKKLMSNNTSNHFKLIMAPIRGKTCGLGRGNETITLP